MKSKLLSSLIGLAAVGWIVSCTSQPKSSQVEENWISNMHKLSAAHLRLMPIAADGRKFADPEMRGRIQGSLKQMVEASNAIMNDNRAPDADPIIKFTAAGLAAEVKQAYTAFEVNDLQWSRFALSRTSSYCISCHTRADRGVKDFEIGWTTELSALTPSQSVEFLLANRRYRSAMTAARKLAADGEQVRREPRNWILTIEKVLGMVVRVNKEPAQAEDLVELVVKNKSAPSYIRRDASTWLQDIRSWRAEEHAGRRRPDLKAVAKLVNKAEKSGPHNSAALIQYLRASGMTHELLENTRSSKYGETLLYAGIVADSLRDLNMGYLDQYYYESCILNQPHSELAERCYSRLEASVRISNPFLTIDPQSEWATAARRAYFRKLGKKKDPLAAPSWNRQFWDGLDKFEKEDKSREKR